MNAKNPAIKSAAIKFIAKWNYINQNGHPEWNATYNEDGKPILVRKRNKSFCPGGAKCKNI